MTAAATRFARTPTGWERDAYHGFEPLLELVDKERDGSAALGWDARRMSRLLARLGEPQLRLRSALVAGSKGKGSTAAMLAAMAGVAGLRAGLYTQPHLHRYAERITIGGRPLSPEVSRDTVRRAAEAAAGAATAFEVATAAALLSFAEAGADVAVVEAGFGGRLDASAACEPSLVVFTPIEDEHDDLLGPGLGEVARRETAVLRFGQACCAAPQPAQVASALGIRAAEQGVVVRTPAPPEPVAGGRLRIRTPGGRVVVAQCALAGRFQEGNAALAAAAAEALGLREPAIAGGLAAVRWPGRFETVRQAPPVVVDGAHTPGSARALAEAVQAAHPGRRVCWVVGMLAGKDVAGFARAIAAAGGPVWTTTVGHPRALAATEVAAVWAEAARAPVAALAVPQALASAAAASAPDGVCVVTGSLALVAEVRVLLGAAR